MKVEETEVGASTLASRLLAVFSPNLSHLVQSLERCLSGQQGPGCRSEVKGSVSALRGVGEA